MWLSLFAVVLKLKETSGKIRTPRGQRTHSPTTRVPHCLRYRRQYTIGLTLGS